VKLITGHKGFIGSTIGSKFDKFYGIEKQYSYDELYYFSNWDDVDEVYHIGAISDTTGTDPLEYHEYNVKFSIKLFQQCIRRRIPVKYVSSGSVYGNSFMSKTISPLNQYALSKVAVDYWVQDNIHLFTKIHGFRLFNVYGNNEYGKGDQASPIFKFTKQAIQDRMIKIFKGSEDIMRDFVCVEDVVDIMTSDINAPSGIYDIGTSNPISFYDVAELVADKYNSYIEEIEFPEHLKEKYQYHTYASGSELTRGYKFKSVSDWLNTLQQVPSYD
jgi:ADP-L-glycero-D-manno-heptose 6-epimerase